MVVDRAVNMGDRVLDCGAGTGSSGLMAAEKSGETGRVVFFDLSDGMLDIARNRANQAGIADRAEFRTGDMISLPFDDNSFDVVLSTYSTCPLYDPAQGALEMFRVVRPGGKIGIAHSTDPRTSWLKWFAYAVEGIAWHFPSVSLGCRSVSVLPTLQGVGGKVVFEKYFGIPLWPFLAFVIEKPAQ